jgi:hypothetical protein
MDPNLVTVKTYYIIHPNGREKLKATDAIAAMAEFKKHWTAKADWIAGKKPLVRRLIETTSTEFLSEPIAKNKVR